MASAPGRGADRPQGAAASMFNGLAVLQAFSTGTPTLGVTEIATRVGLSKSTVSRILSGLAEVDFVERVSQTGRYRLGLGVIALAAPLLADLDIRRAALPFLQELMENTSETAAISVWNGTEAIVVEQVPSPHQVKHTASIGTHYPRYESSSVRVFLAELPPDHADRLLTSGAISRGPCPQLDGPVAAHLQQVRHAGYAINDGCTTEEEYGVSAPIHDFRGHIAGCVTLSAPRSRVHRSHTQNHLTHAVTHAATQISTRLGNPDHTPGPTTAHQTIEGRRGDEASGSSAGA